MYIDFNELSFSGFPSVHRLWVQILPNSILTFIFAGSMKLNISWTLGDGVTDLTTPGKDFWASVKIWNQYSSQSLNGGTIVISDLIPTIFHSLLSFWVQISIRATSTFILSATRKLKYWMCTRVDIIGSFLKISGIESICKRILYSTSTCISNTWNCMLTLYIYSNNSDSCLSFSLYLFLSVSFLKTVNGLCFYQTLTLYSLPPE